MPLPIIPGPNNELTTGSASSIFSFNDPALNVILVDTSSTISKPTTNTATAIYAVDAWNGIVNITLPPSDGNAQFFIKKIDSSANAVRVYPSGSNTIEGASSQNLTTQWASVRLVSYNNTTWFKF
jgi:hypothetical protein